MPQSRPRISSIPKAKRLSVDPNARNGPLLTATLGRDNIETQELYKGIAPLAMGSASSNRGDGFTLR